MSSSLMHRLRDERGIALPLAMFVLALLVLVGGMAMREAVFTSDASTEDRRAKRSLQAADAGIDAALYRMNIYDLVNQPTLKCVTATPGAGGQSQLQLTGYVQVSGEQWCPQVTEDLGDGTSYSYYVAPQPAPDLTGGTQTISRTIVSTGCARQAGASAELCPAGSETRRVATNATAPLPTPLFGLWAVSSRESISMDSNSTVTGSVRANQGISLLSNTRVRCMNDGLTPTLGDAVAGPGYTTSGSSNSVCGSRTPASQPFTLAPVNADVATTNDNARISPSTGCATGDPCTQSGDITWNAAQRRLILDSNSTLTLGGNVYSFCQLWLKSNSKLIIAPRTPGSSVRIYIDKPGDCTGEELPSVFFDSNSTLNNQNNDPSSLQIYVEGNGGVVINSNASGGSSQFPMTIYAPESDFAMDSNVTLFGAVAAKKVTLKSNAKVNFDRRVANISTDGVFPLMRRQAYRECLKAGTGTTPASGC